MSEYPIAGLIKSLERSTRVVLILGLFGMGVGSAEAIEISPALRATVDETADYLQLTEQQRGELGGLVSDEADRVLQVVEGMQDDLGFDSVLDLLTEAKMIQDSFIPSLRGLLDEEQKARLDRLPRDDSFYISTLSSVITEARVGRLRDRLDLSEAQLLEVRSLLETGFQDALSIVAGLGRREEKISASVVLDILTDLRGTQRLMDRGVRSVLNDSQIAILDRDG